MPFEAMSSVTWLSRRLKVIQLSDKSAINHFSNSKWLSETKIVLQIIRLEFYSVSLIEITLKFKSLDWKLRWEILPVCILSSFCFKGNTASFKRQMIISYIVSVLCKTLGLFSFGGIYLLRDLRRKTLQLFHFYLLLFTIASVRGFYFCGNLDPLYLEGIYTHPDAMLYKRLSCQCWIKKLKCKIWRMVTPGQEKETSIWYCTIVALTAIKCGYY